MCNGISPVEDIKKDDFEDLNGSVHWTLDETSEYSLCGIPVSSGSRIGPGASDTVNCVECMDRSSSYGY